MSDETTPTPAENVVEGPPVEGGVGTDVPVADDQGDAAPVVPTDVPADGGEQFYRHAETGELYVTGVDPNGEHYDLPAQMVPTAEFDDLAAKVADLEAALTEKDALLAQRDAEVTELEDRVADLEAAPAGDGDTSGLGGVRTAALDAFEDNQFKGEVQAWERETGLSYEDTEPEVVDDGTPAEWADGVDPTVQAKSDAEASA